MLRASTQAASAELQRLVEQILDEETRARIIERRDAARQAITRPVVIEPRDEPGRGINALARNISEMGIGVISAEPLRPNTLARIVITRSEGAPSIVLAECRWCESFQNGWYVSGWNFVSVLRG
jgi:hypothetical protein